MNHGNQTRITQKGRLRHRVWSVGLYLLVFSAIFLTSSAAMAQATPREQFVAAWNAASRGDYGLFRQLQTGLEQYQLFPYLVYENMRHSRARVAPADMASFLDQHSGWAFTEGLRLTWLKTLGKQGRWLDLIQYADGSRDTEVRCYRARALIETGQADGLMSEAQSLWTVGKSQVSQCDPVFDWLRRNGGITPALAWERIHLAMMQGNERLTRYLERYIPANEQRLLDRWQDLHRNGYRNLSRLRSWPDEELSRMIAEVSLIRLANRDADRAWESFRQLDGHFKWPDNTRGGILREIALQAAVALSADTFQVMDAVPSSHRDDQLLQWWARAALVSQEWIALKNVIGQMPPESKADARWRYWLATASDALGDTAGTLKILEPLSGESNYYGFLAADQLKKPYTICPLNPSVSPQSISLLRNRADISRALELRAAGIGNWAAAEWSLAAGRLDPDMLRTAAAVAREEDWHDRVIFALGNSGDLQFYEWRFPLLWRQEVESESASNKLDPAWVHGVMRSESALDASARSSAGALGLMQVTPATARQISRQHGLAYSGSRQLTEAALNIRFGTRYMRELLDRYDQNPVLVSGAYNAGPRVVDRWLRSRPAGDAAVWIESIPYFETRDYIPRVMAFTTIYNWRMQKPVTRISSRMPDVDSGNIGPVETTEIVCPAPG